MKITYELLRAIYRDNSSRNAYYFVDGELKGMRFWDIYSDD